jgi:hypothetical protein
MTQVCVHICYALKLLKHRKGMDLLGYGHIGEMCDCKDSLPHM